MAQKLRCVYTFFHTEYGDVKACLFPFLRKESRVKIKIVMDTDY